MAPASVGIDTFPNKKPKLSGDVVSDLTRNMVFPAAIAGFSCIGSQLVFQTIGSTSVTISHAANELFIQGQASFRVSSSNRQQVRIIRDNDENDVLATFTTGIGQTTGVWVLSTTIFNETIAAHTYQWQILITVNLGENCCVENSTFFNLLSEADDTHDTKNTKIING